MKRHAVCFRGPATLGLKEHPAEFEVRDSIRDTKLQEHASRIWQMLDWGNVPDEVRQKLQDRPKVGVGSRAKPKQARHHRKTG